jgi:predicted secreted protein
MSNSAAFALIIANFFTSFFCFLYATKMANDIAVEIETGVTRGAPISTKYRRIMLYSTWGGYVTAAIGAGMLAALVSMGIAAHTTDGHVKAIAYAHAVIGAVGGFGIMGNAVPELIHHRAVIRQAEAS